MSQKDQFADLLSSVSSGRKNNVNKMSLAERQRENLTSPASSMGPRLNNGGSHSDSWSGLDLLGGGSGAGSSRATNTPSNDLDFDIFGSGASSNSTGNQLTSAQTTSTATNPNSKFDLDDIFGSSTTVNSTPSSSSHQTTNNNHGNLLDDDEFTDAFQVEEPQSQPEPEPRLRPAPPKPRKSSASTVPAPSESEMYKRDEVIAELMEMGFPLEVAKRALSRTKDYDVNEAISIIMTEAHESSKSKARERPSPSPSASAGASRRTNNGDDLTLAMQDLSLDLKATLFSLLSKGRQKLAKGIEMYKEQQFASNDNQPAWMKNQAVYKQQSINLDDDEEFDKEQMRRIVEKQRAYDKQVREEKERRLRLEKQANERLSAGFDEPAASSKFDAPIRRQDSSSKFDLPLRRQQSSSKFEEPIKRQSSTSKFDLPTRRPTSKFDEPLRRPHSAAPPPRPAAPTAPAPSSVPAAPLPTETLDIFNSGPSSNSVIPDIPISTFQSESYKDSREKGNDFFKKGDFSSALLKYQDSLNSLPQGHKLSVIMLSNISSAQFKLGNSKECLSAIDQALKLLASWDLDLSNCSGVEIDENKPLKPLWLKLIARKAESLEHSEKLKDALANYNLCIENGGSNKLVLDGKNRVQKMLQAENNVNGSAPPRPAQSKPVQNKPRPATRLQTVSEGQNLKNLKSQNKLKEQEEIQKFALHDKIEEKVAQWKEGKTDNLRALLSSLHLILWRELGWKQLALTDLVLDKKVKIYYMKAVAKTHPDKLINATVEQKMIAQNVFVTLNQAWEKFKKDNNIS